MELYNPYKWSYIFYPNLLTGDFAKAHFHRGLKYTCNNKRHGRATDQPKRESATKRPKPRVDDSKTSKIWTSGGLKHAAFSSLVDGREGMDEVWGDFFEPNFRSLGGGNSTTQIFLGIFTPFLGGNHDPI